MPTYEYKCANCNHEFEIFQSIKDDALALCTKCGHNSLRKLVSMPGGIIFKGTGFYQTDYKKSSDQQASSEASLSRNAKPDKSEKHLENTKTVSQKIPSDSGSIGKKSDSHKPSSASASSQEKSDAKSSGSKNLSESSKKKETKPDPLASSKKE